MTKKRAHRRQRPVAHRNNQHAVERQDEGDNEVVCIQFTPKGARLMLDILSGDCPDFFPAELRAKFYEMKNDPERMSWLRRFAAEGD